MSGTPFSKVNNIHVHSMIPEDQIEDVINVFVFVINVYAVLNKKKLKTIIHNILFATFIIMLIG